MTKEQATMKAQSEMIRRLVVENDELEAENLALRQVVADTQAELMLERKRNKTYRAMKCMGIRIID